MTNNKTTKRALLSSVLALFLCFAMLLGTTFAWFTDSAVSGNNIIKTGNLDMKLSYKPYGAENTTWNEVDESTVLFGKDALYEPGYTEAVWLKVENLGSLAFRYDLAINVANEKQGTNKADEKFSLSDYLEVKYMTATSTDMESNFYTTRESLDSFAWGSALNSGVASFDGDIAVIKNGVAYAKDDAVNGSFNSAYVLVVISMPTTVGNEANHNGTDLPEIDFTLTAVATQLAYEKDSFDDQYDADASYVTPVATLDAFFDAVDNGDDVLLIDQISVNESLVNYLNERYPAASTFSNDDTVTVDMDAVIDGNGITVYRTEKMAGKPFFAVDAGYTLVLSNITLDGGAEWEGEIDPVLLRGTVNGGMTTSAAIISTTSGHIVLEEGAVIRNNDGANAINIGTRTGGTLVINGGEIINNHSAAGAIWGGGEITINDGKVNGNHGGIGGAIRVVTNIGTVLTMNGGEMNHNYSDGVGGAIWAGTSRSNNVYVLNGGEMAYNYSPVGGGAIYAGYYETVKIGGSFKMHDNSAPLAGAIRFHDHASFVMTGGEIYNNGDNSLFLFNNSASITGGRIADEFTYGGGLGFTLGEADIESVVTFDLSTNHNTAYLAENFNTLSFTVNEADEHFANFNFKPASTYVYTEGDEDKLICMNEGYSTYWDAASMTFKIKAD